VKLYTVIVTLFKVETFKVFTEKSFDYTGEAVNQKS